MTEYLVILTASYHGGQISFSGVVSPRPGATRLELFTQVMEQLTDRAGEKLTPVFFSLEPNQLTAR